MQTRDAFISKKTRCFAVTTFSLRFLTGIDARQVKSNEVNVRLPMVAETVRSWTTAESHSTLKLKHTCCLPAKVEEVKAKRRAIHHSCLSV